MSGNSSITGRVKRAFAAGGRDYIGIVAAGVAHYAFFAIVPLLAAAVLIYGLVADPQTVARHISALAENLPSSAAELIGGQLESVTEANGSTQGLGLVVALAIALFGARNGAGSVITGLNIAYSTDQQRGFVRANLLALAITLGALIGAGLVAGATTVLAALESLIPGLGGFGVVLGKIITYAVLLAAGIGGALVLFHVAPDRDASWRSDLPGAIFTGIGWVLLTFLFGLYVANFGSYNATYGSLGAVIVLLTWLYLTAYILLFGAELNANWSADADGDSGPHEKTKAR